MKNSSPPTANPARASLRDHPPLGATPIWPGIYEERAPPGPLPYRGEGLAVSLLRQLFRDYPGTVVMRLWSGDAFSVGTADGPPISEARFVLVFTHPQAVSTLILGRDPLRLADAYFRSDVDIEGNFFAALELKDHLQSLTIRPRDRFRAVLTALRLPTLNPRALPLFGENVPARSHRAQTHSKDDNSRSIRFHYDVSNDFYQLWLDRSMVYSCGYFERSGQTLDEAQTAKMDHICRKLLLRPNERFLDIGCGWGSLLIHAASKYGVFAHGVTLSEKQLTFAQRSIAEAGLAGRVTVELKDYRDLPKDSFDKVASVGMFEHVGLKNLPLYFSTVCHLLKVGGLFLNHGITHARAGWQRNVSTEFINRYVFPDAELDCISNIQHFMERAEFEIEDVESLRVHYAMTLRAWVDRLEHRHAEALDFVSEATFRVWRLYMTACAQEFDSGQVGIYQVLASRRGLRNRQLPLTRHHLYSEH